jgi:hypothetical protein
MPSQSLNKLMSEIGGGAETLCPILNSRY